MGTTGRGVATDESGDSTQAQDSLPVSIPSVYTVTTGYSKVVSTFHLREESGRLLVTQQMKGVTVSNYAVTYSSVNYVGVIADSWSADLAKTEVETRGSEGTISIFLPTEAQAAALAAYIAEKSPFQLEMIGDAWRVREHFECPEGSQPGCQDFVDLLDHGDPEIADYFYSHEAFKTKYVCFDNVERHFFILNYTRFASLPKTRGILTEEAFTNG